MFIAPSDTNYKNVIKMIGTFLAAGNALSKKSPTSHTVYHPDLSKHGQSYQSLAEANPYSNVNYRQSWMQKVLQNLGFRTNYDSYLESMNLQAQEYDNALLQKEYDEKYNDPLAQVQRERAAGLNPDLTGNVGPGESSELRDDGNPPVAPEADDLGKVSEFAGNVIQGVELAFGLFGNVQGFRNAFLTNQGKQIENSKNFMDFTQDAILHVKDAVYENQSGPDWSIADNYYNSYKKAFGKHMSKRQFRKLIEQAQVFEHGLSTSSAEWSERNKRSGERLDYFKRTSGQNAYSEVDETMTALYAPLADLAKDVTSERLQADKLKALNDQDYENMVRPQETTNKQIYEQNRNPAEEAKQLTRGLKLENDIKSENLKGLRYQRKLRKSFEVIMNKLDKLSDSGNTFAQIVQMVLSTIMIKSLGE